MSRAFLAAVALAVPLGILMFLGMGVNPFILWNALPVALAVGGIWLAHKSGSGWPLSLRFAAWGFFAGAGGITAFVQIAWYWDIGGTATGGSTSGLVFLFAPMYAMVLGGIAAILAGAVGLVLTGIFSMLRKRPAGVES